MQIGTYSSTVVGSHREHVGHIPLQTVTPRYVPFRTVTYRSMPRQELAAQRKLVGGKMTQSGLLSAHDVLTEAYEVHEFTVQRTKMGMGVVMDSASNVIVELEEGSTGANSGLMEGDAVMMVDKVVVTVIEGGMVVPRSPITAVIDPVKTELTFTVFRPKGIDLA